MRCRDDADVWRLCTPFSSKILNDINPLTFRSYIFSLHCISDLGYTDYGEECSTTCGLVLSGSDEWNYWCRTVNASIAWDRCTPIVSSKYFQILSRFLNFVTNSKYLFLVRSL